MIMLAMKIRCAKILIDEIFYDKILQIYGITLYSIGDEKGRGLNPSPWSLGNHNTLKAKNCKKILKLYRTFKYPNRAIKGIIISLKNEILIFCENLWEYDPT